MFKHKKLLLAAVPLLVIILAAAVVLFVRLNRPHDPTSAFWTAMQTAMSTRGITCTIHDETSGRISTQKVSLDLLGKTDAISQMSLQQNSESYTVDGVATANADYVRYVSLGSTDKNAPKPHNLNSVLGVWSKQNRDNSTASLFDLTSLGGCVLPLGNLSSTRAKGLVTDMQKNKVMTVDTRKAVKATENGFNVYRYSVTVPPTQYVSFMKRFADAYGLKSLKSVSASSFNGKLPPSIVISVDSHKQIVRQITFMGQNHTIAFSNYGIRPDVQAPAKTITVSQLEQRLQSLK